MSKYEGFSGLYFPVFGMNTENYVVTELRSNTGKCGLEKPPYLDSFHTVTIFRGLNVYVKDILWTSRKHLKKFLDNTKR